MLSYFILFLSAFGAATLLPFYSEVVFIGLLAQDYSVVMLWSVATLGNTLGAVVNWGLGRYLIHFQSKKWFPFKPEKIKTSQRWFQRYGKWSLLMSWLPIGGDALTFIAGIMRVNLLWFLVLVGLGKGGRYLFVIFIYNQF